MAALCDDSMAQTWQLWMGADLSAFCEEGADPGCPETTAHRDDLKAQTWMPRTVQTWLHSAKKVQTQAVVDAGGTGGRESVATRTMPGAAQSRGQGIGRDFGHFPRRFPRGQRRFS